jgi:hypothetical protein
MSANHPSSERCPLRDVVTVTMRYRSEPRFKVLLLSCGHEVIRQPAFKAPGRMRCDKCGESNG